MSAPDFRNVAAQLRMPHGEDGLKTAGYMSVNNRNMIERTIDLLDIQKNDEVLELGYGGGMHLGYLLGAAEDVSYTGIDISTAMQQLAAENNAGMPGRYAFLQADASGGFLQLPFPDSSFDRIFSVNTIYFWDNAPAQARELMRVLRPGGCFIVTFGSRDFMQGLPFTQYGFELYDIEKASALLSEAGFSVKAAITETETVPGMEGEGIVRDFVMLCASKL